MSIKFTCDDKQTLVAYLYGEVDHATRLAVDAHLDACAACASEVTALGDVRSELGLWVPPDVELDFTIVKKSQLPPAAVLRPARWWSGVPAWAQAAAAILVLAAGAAIANVQVTSGPEGFSVSTGWMAQPASSAAPDRDALGREVESWKTELASFEQKLRDELRATRADSPARAASAVTIDEATMRRVRQLIGEAEQRHSRELAARMIEFTNDMNMQRNADLVRISRAINAQDTQMLRQRQMINSQGQLINNAIRVSSVPQQ